MHCGARNKVTGNDYFRWYYDDAKKEEKIRNCRTPPTLDSTRPWTEAAASTTNCTLGNINGHAVGHDGWRSDVGSWRLYRVRRPTGRIIFVAWKVAAIRIVDCVPAKENMHVWKTFRVFLPSFDGGRVHSVTQVGQDEQTIVPCTGDWRQQANASIQGWRDSRFDWFRCS